MSIQTIDSAPDYIMKFIHMNMEKLCNIYDEGIYNNALDKGILFLKCSDKQNKMDVQFMTDEMMEFIIDKESIQNLKNNTDKDKKMLFIEDIDLNSVFLIQV